MLTIGDCVRHANSRFGEQNLARCSEVGELGDRFEQIITWPTSYGSMIEATTPLLSEDLGTTRPARAARHAAARTSGADLCERRLPSDLEPRLVCPDLSGSPSL